MLETFLFRHVTISAGVLIEERGPLLRRAVTGHLHDAAIERHPQKLFFQVELDS